MRVEFWQQFLSNAGKLLSEDRHELQTKAFTKNRTGNHRSEPQNNHIEDTRIIIMSATAERSLWAPVFQYCFKIAIIVSQWARVITEMEQLMVRIPSNGSHKSEPQYYHIKYIWVITKSAIVGRSFLALNFNYFFKIALILFL